MSDTTLDQETFRERWTDQADDFSALKHTLPEDEWDRLEETIDEMQELVEIASNELSDEPTG